MSCRTGGSDGGEPTANPRYEKLANPGCSSGVHGVVERREPSSCIVMCI